MARTSYLVPRDVAYPRIFTKQLYSRKKKIIIQTSKNKELKIECFHFLFANSDLIHTILQFAGNRNAETKQPFINFPLSRFIFHQIRHFSALWLVARAVQRKKIGFIQFQNGICLSSVFSACIKVNQYSWVKERRLCVEICYFLWLSTKGL